MNSKILMFIVSTLFTLAVTGCNENSNSLSISENSPVGLWYYDSTITSADGKILSMSMTFDIRQDSTYVRSSKLTINTKVIYSADTGTWILSGSNFIRKRLATWMSNIATGEYERLTPSSSVDTLKIDLKKNLLYFSENEVFKRK